MIGQMLEGRYRIDAPIARGGMSMVFRGTDTRLDRPVAIKVMDPKFAGDPQFLTRFEFEARAVAKLKHPSLVAVYDQGIDGEYPFLIMELVEGGTLRELLRERGPMPPHAVRAVAEPVLRAIGTAHDAGLVHRDVKPENVLISDAGEVKIADFGLVRAVAAANTTSASVILGTAAYLSPEQVTTGTADARSDVYSFGILIFELLTGQVPFTGDNSLSVAYQRVENDVPAPSTLIGGVPPELDALVAKATARDPQQRFADANEMAARLQTIAMELNLPPYRVPAPRDSAEHLSESYRTGAAHHPGERPMTPPPVAPHPVAVHQAAPPDHQPQHTRVVTAPRPRPDEYASAHAAHNPFAPNENTSRRTGLVWASIVTALTLLVGIGGWWLGVGRYTAVPPIAGMDSERAVAVLQEAGFETVLRNKASDTIPVGGVVGTDPSAGSRVTKGSTVAVLISNGKPRVPDIKPGDQISATNQAIRDAGLQPIDSGEAPSTAPKGTLAKVDPAPGTILPMGAQVKVYRSKGSQPVNVPDVRGKSAEEAAQALATAGLTVRDTRVQYDKSVEGDKAIGTDPAVGTTLQSGDSVTLIVSNAVKVPNVMGQTVGNARAKLQQLGLRVEVKSITDSDSSLVIGQVPGFNSNVEAGSVVTLTALP
ncbi:serine/threonine protein kinase PknL [Nocardia asteroides NBRC 15531]|uniref:non-specific serine/threonine protein kinase n=2 Tax=Nocardia asteroides TaxID=1824 RepID=U5E7I0_NOCAS|nr:serine/threonine protein kinase PknL [Nocardia asteroides NBRC 15531]SFN62048.1 serine/threonine protein kinase [Nocardia asteroides]VEG34454.1 Serine/threonine-protein kinase PrkC [Nocardia asteroides]